MTSGSKSEGQSQAVPRVPRSCQGQQLSTAEEETRQGCESSFLTHKRSHQVGACAVLQGPLVIFASECGTGTTGQRRTRKGWPDGGIFRKQTLFWHGSASEELCRSPRYHPITTPRRPASLIGRSAGRVIYLATCFVVPIQMLIKVTCSRAPARSVALIEARRIVWQRRANTT
jgi:hypothetical protein